MKIVILGHNGMLGSMACRYFDNKFAVGRVYDRLSEDNYDQFIQTIVNKNPDMIINALGQIKQKYDDAHEMNFINGEFPKRLANALPTNCVLVHPSTDCVFSGKTGNYSLTDVPDASDVYGVSKRTAESIASDKTLVIRTSIIGLEKTTTRSLLSWFLDQHDTVNGFTNWHWSGVTTLAWCQSVELLLNHNIRGLCQLATPRISKYDLLVAAKDVFQHDVSIVPTQSTSTVDRSLRDSRLPLVDIKTQMQELRVWGV